MKPKTPLIETRRMYLKRLDRLVHMRRSYWEDLNPVGLRLLDRSIAATYLEACDFGGKRQAMGLLDGVYS